MGTEFGSDTRSFKFIGPDGVEYKWALGATGVKCPRVSLLIHSLTGTLPALNHGLKLVTTDGEKTEIAKFHRARCFPKRQKARLEVQPAGMGMLDHMFAEQKRRERETAANSGGGGG